MNTTRANPFADIENLPAFEPKPRRRVQASTSRSKRLPRPMAFPVVKLRGRRHQPRVANPVDATRRAVISKSTSRRPRSRPPG